MAFTIKFVGDEFEEEGVRLHRLVLTIGDFSEAMYADVTNWSTTDYQRQWFNELKAMTDGKARGALLTSLHDPRIGRLIRAWPMWREDNIVYFQNRIIGMLAVEPRFDANLVDEVIDERQEVNEDGITISQWQIPVTEIRAFLNRGITA